MRTVLKILFIFLLIFNSFSEIVSVSAYTPSSTEINLKTGADKIENEAVKNNNHLKSLENTTTDFIVSEGGQKGLYNSIIRIARDLKNLFFIIAGLYFVIIVLKLLFSSKTEEEASNFKKGLIWISVGIVITQISYYFINILFDKEINVELASHFTDIILKPFIGLLETAASFFFLAMMMYAFFKIITANGDDEKAKGGKMSVLYAAAGFIIIKISNALVTTTYGKTNCTSFTSTNCINQTDLTGFASIVVKLIDWMNGFVGIIVIIMIIYAGFLTLTSGGDEEKLKKAKNIIIYIAIGLLILVTNYMILTFFILKNA